MELVFAVSALFHDQVLFFLCVFCWNNEYFPDNISPIWVKKVCEKNLYWLFFNNTFPIAKISINLFHYICGIFIKILNFNDRLGIRWRDQKNHVTLTTFLGLFWKILYSTTLMQSFIGRAYKIPDLWRRWGCSGSKEL